MRKITRTLYLNPEELKLIDKDVNAVEKYTVFSNKETGTIEVEVCFSVSEEFKVTEDVLRDIIEGLSPSLTEEEVELRFTKVINHLRNIGASV